MDRIWYIIILGMEEGPYAAEELATDVRVTWDTLAWKEGFDKWLPIRDIPELRELLQLRETEEEKPSIAGLQDELVLDLQKDPSFLFLWLAVAAIIIFYLCYAFFWS